jgi:2',3'-cyclic-nucleotide 2'-phosphodiesterase (5'-nucleotidase family)
MIVGSRFGVRRRPSSLRGKSTRGNSCVAAATITKMAAELYPVTTMFHPLSRAALAGAVALACLAAGAARAQSDTPATEIFFHADVDGRFAVPACGRAGKAVPDYAALLGTLAVRRAAAAERGAPAPVVLLGGNWAGPDPFVANLVQADDAGPPALVSLLALAHYDAIALGHNELALGPAGRGRLLGALAAAGIPVIASNLACEGTHPACAATRRELIVKRPDATIGLLATISPVVMDGIPPGARAGLSLTDPAAAIRAGVARLRAAGATQIVVVADGRRDSRSLEDVDALARQLAGDKAPDLILSSGLRDEASGRALRLLRRDGVPPVSGAPAGTGALSRVTLAGGDVTADIVPTGAAPADPAAADLLAPAVATTCARLAVPLGPAGVHGSLKRDDFVDYVLEVMRRRARAEIALVNRDFVKRAPFPLTGTVTRGDLERALPYRAVIGAARVQGPSVESLLGPALANPRLAAVGLARVDGSLKVNGRPIDKARAYRVATIAFVAGGGDGIFAKDALPYAPLPGGPDVRDEVEDFLRGRTGARDGDPTIDAGTDFGRPAADRALWVALGDAGLDLSDTSISNPSSYGDAQLTRARQTALKGQVTVVTQLRHPLHEMDGRFDVQYGWARTWPQGMPVSSGETSDLVTAILLYTYRGLRQNPRLPGRFVPDPYARLWLESELTRPEVTATQMRTYHHLQLTGTAGGQLTLTPKLKLRAGLGAQRELLAAGPPGTWRPVIEAGATLDSTAIATFGPLAVKLEGLVNYDVVDPTGAGQQQVRGNVKLAVPLVPTLFLTVGLDVFGVQREDRAWGASFDTTIGVRVHTDFARQML